MLASIVKEANLPTAAGLAMEQNITAFEDCLGGCERILRTPIPLYYTRQAKWRCLLSIPYMWMACSGSCLVDGEERVARWQ